MAKIGSLHQEQVPVCLHGTAHSSYNAANTTDEVLDISAEVAPAPVVPTKNSDSNNEDDDDEEIPDMESFEGDNLVEDDAVSTLVNGIHHSRT